MRINRQHQATTGVIADIVIAIRFVPVANQQAILIAEELHPIGSGVGKAEVIGIAQRGIEAAVATVLANVGVEVEIRFNTGRDAEAASRRAIRPATIGLCAIGSAASNWRTVMPGLSGAAKSATLTFECRPCRE